MGSQLNLRMFLDLYLSGIYSLKKCLLGLFQESAKFLILGWSHLMVHLLELVLMCAGSWLQGIALTTGIGRGRAETLELKSQQRSFGQLVVLLLTSHRMLLRSTPRRCHKKTS